MEEAPIRFHSLDREYEKTFRALISPAYQGKTEEHPHPWIGWNFSQRFPDLPGAYRRSVIKDVIGKARSYLSHRVNWEKSGKRKGKPGLPGASEHPTLYKGTWELDLSDVAVKNRFVRRKRL